MKKLFFFPALLLLLAGAFTACDDDNTEEGPKAIRISTEDLTQQFTLEGESRFVAVTHSKLFDLKSSDPSWCNVKRTGNGLRITGINITVDKNTQAADRSAEITIWADDVDPVVIQVSQSAAPAALSVKEKSILVKGTLTFNLTVTANFEIEFVLPAWVTQNNEVTGEGTHSFTAEAVEDGAEPRTGEIVVKAKTLTGVNPVTIPIRQEPASDKKMPELPTIPAPAFTAKWVDLYFVKDGYANTPTNTDTEGTDRVELRTGAKTPASVWNNTLNCYVASYPEATSDTYYAAIFDDRVTSNFNSEPTAIQAGFTMETYLKVSDVTQEYIRPFANFDARGNGQLGLGLQIINGTAQFTCSNMNSNYRHMTIGPWDTGKYYHIMVVYQKSKGSTGNTMILYVDGEKVDETGAMGDWTTVVWDKIRGIGIGGNFAQPTDDNPAVVIKDGMIGEVAFFRWYSDELTAANAATRYAAITTRASSAKFADLKTMVETTLPVKAETGISGELKAAISEAIKIGWSLMGNFETTEETVTAYLKYADELLDFE